MVEVSRRLAAWLRTTTRTSACIRNRLWARLVTVPNCPLVSGIQPPWPGWSELKKGVSAQADLKAANAQSAQLRKNGATLESGKSQLDLGLMRGQGKPNAPSSDPIMWSSLRDCNPKPGSFRYFCEGHLWVREQVEEKRK